MAHSDPSASTPSSGRAEPPSPGPVCGLTVLAWQLGELDVAGLWWLYLGLGGSADRVDLELYLNGLASWSAHEHDVLTQALNEQMWATDQASLAPLRGIPSPDAA